MENCQKKEVERKVESVRERSRKRNGERKIGKEKEKKREKIIGRRLVQ